MKKKNVTLPKNKKPNRITWEKALKFPFPQLVIIALNLIVYFSVLSFGVTRFDDNLLITNNIKNLSDFGNIGKAFQTDAFFQESGKGTFYRPLQTVTYMIDVHLSKDFTRSGHFTNLLLHILTCILVFSLLYNIGIRRQLGLFGGLIFGLHPLFTHAVAWLPARGDLLLTVFSLLSFLMLIYYEKHSLEMSKTDSGNKFYLLAISVFSFALALFSKEAAIVLPFLFIIYFLIKDKSFLKCKAFISIIVIDIVMIALWSLLRNAAVNASGISNFGVEPFISNLRALIEYFEKMIVIFDIPVMTSYTLRRSLIGLVILIIGLFFAFRRTSADARKMIFFGMIWFFVAMMPSLAFRHEHADYYYEWLDHRTYLPSFGIFLCVFILINDKLMPSNNRIIYILSCILILSGVFSYIQSNAYENPVKYYTTAIKDNPKSAVSYLNLGVFRQDNGDFRNALEDFNSALKLKPDFADALINRGLTKKSLNDPAGAIDDYNHAIELRSSNIEFAFYNRGTVYGQIAKQDLAIADYDSAMQYKPKWSEAMLNRGNAYLAKADSAQALLDYNAALEIDPNFATAYFNRGSLFGQLGRLDEGMRDLNRAIDLKPDYGDAYSNRANIFVMLKDMGSACRDWREAAKYGNQNAANYSKMYCK